MVLSTVCRPMDSIHLDLQSDTLFKPVVQFDNQGYDNIEIGFEPMTSGFPGSQMRAACAG